MDMLHKLGVLTAERDAKEGTSQHQAGDYLVSNNQDGTDPNCFGAAKFESTYELDE